MTAEQHERAYRLHAAEEQLDSGCPCGWSADIAELLELIDTDELSAADAVEELQRLAQRERPA